MEERFIVLQGIVSHYLLFLGFWILCSGKVYKWGKNCDSSDCIQGWSSMSHHNQKSFISNICTLYKLEVPKMVTVYTPGGIIHTNNYQGCTVLVLSDQYISRWSYMICDVICICRRAPGGLCCLREPSQSTNLSNMEIHLALILHFPYELKLFVQFLLFIVVMSWSIFQVLGAR